MKIRKQREIWILGGIIVLLVAGAVTYFVLAGSNEPPVTKQPTQSKPAVLAKPATPPDPAIIDNRRRTAGTATLNMLLSYAADNNGTYPTTADELRLAVDTYGKQIASSTVVVYKPSYDPAEVPGATSMFYYPGYACTAVGEPTPSSSRSVAVRYALTNGTYECVDNS